MAITLIVEDGTGLSNANTYATQVEATAYHDAHLYGTDWSGASTGDKDKALAMATRLLDDNFIWNGRKFTDTQALEWPRYQMQDRNGHFFDSTTIPARLKNATAELARWLIQGDRTAETDDLGFKRIKAGPLEIVVDKNDRQEMIPDVVLRMIDHFGRAKGRGTVKVTR